MHDAVFVGGRQGIGHHGRHAGRTARRDGPVAAQE